MPATKEIPTPKLLSFKPRARLIRTIGDRLISGPEAALIELVKNAHDADAEWVRVTFVPPVTPGKGSVVVADNGHGMSLKDIQDKWMEPATTDKITRLRSPGKRTLLGSKGIGRFAAARLGQNLTLDTTALNADGRLETSIVGEIDWNRFDEITYLSDVTFPYQVTVGSNAAQSTGTKLTISNLRDQWTEVSFQKLFRELRRLISPLAIFDGGFRIYLDLSACTRESCGFDAAAIVNAFAASDLEEQERDLVRPLPLLKSCDYEIDGTFDVNGSFMGKMTVHRGEQESRDVILDVPLDPTLDEASCGEILVQFFIFDRETSAVRHTIQKAGLGDISINEARNLLDDISGIAIYRHGFRIRPYGDSDQDWLTLDSRRVQDPSFRIGHNHVSGIIVIDEERRSRLVERSSREGLEINWHFRRFQRLILSLFSEVIEPRRWDFRVRAGLDRPRDFSFKKAREASVLSGTERFASHLDPAMRSEFETWVERESSILERTINTLEQRQALLESRATLGRILEQVIHESRAPLTFIQDETNRLQRWGTTLFDNDPVSEQHRKELPNVLRGLGSSSEKLRVLFNALRPLSAQRRGSVSRYSAAQVVKDTFFLFRSSMEDGGIDHSVRAAPSLPDLEGFRNDLATAVANLIDNSIYWLKTKQTPEPRISVDIAQLDDAAIHIEFSDNGPGIPEEFSDRIFDVGFTLRPNGSGLGLSIAQEALHRSQGQITLDPTMKSGASFLITLPLE